MIEWREPEISSEHPGRGNRRNFEHAAHVLRSSPGRWAVVATYIPWPRALTMPLYGRETVRDHGGRKAPMKR